MITFTKGISSIKQKRFQYYYIKGEQVMVLYNNIGDKKFKTTNTKTGHPSRKAFRELRKRKFVDITRQNSFYSNNLIKYL